MRLACFRFRERTCVGVVLADEQLLDLSDLVETPDAGVMRLWERLQNEGMPDTAGRMRLAQSQVELLPPVPAPRQFFGIGLNYRTHAREMGLEIPERPRVFIKLPGSVNQPRGTVARPAFAHTLDYEGELGVVIGRTCHRVSAANAADYIAGFCVVNDFSIREYVNPDLLLLGKGCAGFGPFGPWLTGADEVPDPQALRIRTWVNGELRQDDFTANQIFTCTEIIEWLSRAIRLMPGDVIATGSPSGTCASRPDSGFLQAGDQVRVAIDGLGELQHDIIDECF
ncbi:MAG: fumarylacetoacetate hydrolase family protein [Gammaproteobacteria bacterium]|nr:fumarylacetoacetate hydrolase family protein [Gammaproteobacteria bacterium]